MLHIVRVLFIVLAGFLGWWIGGEYEDVGGSLRFCIPRMVWSRSDKTTWFSLSST